MIKIDSVYLRDTLHFVQNIGEGHKTSNIQLNNKIPRFLLKIINLNNLIFMKLNKYKSFHYRVMIYKCK
jgi:hypothetical protein